MKTSVVVAYNMTFEARTKFTEGPDPKTCPPVLLSAPAAPLP